MLINYYKYKVKLTFLLFIQLYKILQVYKINFNIHVVIFPDQLIKEISHVT